ncbi:MAG: pyruvate dehydrogenase [Bdellovibrionaceae bacterium]|nr:pyruvate dehydrogenase [Bdellovibrionales bacterium]MCB9253587.1 pyruvate dehydrogenase [Pseudobdellovibrionaceae bacterium]
MSKLDYEVLNNICDRAFYLALQMIHLANHRPGHGKGEPKVGGHATACASSQHILTALHMVARHPEDYMACKPHVSPMDHGLNFLLHNFRDKDANLFDKEKRQLAMRHLRHFSSTGEPVFQSYHAEADPDGYRFFPSGSVGIPPVNALYTALAYDFAHHHNVGLKEDPFFWCLMGDSEFREGSLAEAMPDAGERQLNHVVWVVDYNRQNLDGTRISNEKAFNGSDADRMARIAEANGWHAVILKHGKLRREFFKREGGDEFKRVLNECFTDFEFQGLLEANKPDLTRKVLEEKSPKLKSFFKDCSDEEVHKVFLNLGGHDLESLVETFQEARKSDRPTFVVAYTIKGYKLRCQAKSGNHSTLPEEDELREMAQGLGLDFDNPFQDFEESSKEGAYLKERREFLVDGIQKLLAEVKQRQQKWVAFARSLEWPVDFDITALKFNPVAHTQWMWGQVAAKLDRLGRGEDTAADDQGWGVVAKFFLTMAPDVGTSTNTSPNMNGKLYGDIAQEDFELRFEAKDTKAPDVVPRISQKSGHLRFEIAEGNCMSAAGSFGKFFDYVGIPFYPAMTIYDFFIKRAHDQYYYNLYWRSCFATLGTPSGVTLAPEGAQHSWKSDFQIPHVVTWEPCFAKEVEWILADTLRRHFTRENENREAALIRCVTKGLVQKDFLGRLSRQHRFKLLPEGHGPLTTEMEPEVPHWEETEILETVRKEVLEGAYPLIDYRGYEGYTPGDNVIHIFAMGALGEEAIQASDKLLEKGIFANVFIVTSSDLLLGNQAYGNHYEHLRNGLKVTGDLYLTPDTARVDNLAKWYSLRGNRIPIVSVHDGEPGLLDNIGSIVGVKHISLAVRKTSKSGTTGDIYRYHHLDADSIAGACEQALSETSQEKLVLSPAIFETIATDRESVS